MDSFLESYSAGADGRPSSANMIDESHANGTNTVSKRSRHERQSSFPTLTGIIESSPSMRMEHDDDFLSSYSASVVPSSAPSLMPSRRPSMKHSGSSQGSQTSIASNRSSIVIGQGSMSMPQQPAMWNNPSSITSQASYTSQSSDNSTYTQHSTSNAPLPTQQPHFRASQSVIQPSHHPTLQHASRSMQVQHSPALRPLAATLESIASSPTSAATPGVIDPFLSSYSSRSGNSTPLTGQGHSPLPPANVVRPSKSGGTRDSGLKDKDSDASRRKSVSSRPASSSSTSSTSSHRQQQSTHHSHTHQAKPVSSTFLQSATSNAIRVSARSTASSQSTLDRYATTEEQAALTHSMMQSWGGAGDDSRDVEVPSIRGNSGEELEVKSAASVLPRMKLDSQHGARSQQHSSRPSREHSPERTPAAGQQHHHQHNHHQHHHHQRDPSFSNQLVRDHKAALKDALKIDTNFAKLSTKEQAVPLEASMPLVREALANGDSVAAMTTTTSTTVVAAIPTLGHNLTPAPLAPQPLMPRPPILITSPLAAQPIKVGNSPTLLTPKAVHSPSQIGPIVAAPYEFPTAVATAPSLTVNTNAPILNLLKTQNTPINSAFSPTNGSHSRDRSSGANSGDSSHGLSVVPSPQPTIVAPPPQNQTPTPVVSNPLPQNPVEEKQAHPIFALSNASLLPSGSPNGSILPARSPGLAHSISDPVAGRSNVNMSSGEVSPGAVAAVAESYLFDPTLPGIQISEGPVLGGQRYPPNVPQGQPQLFQSASGMYQGTSSYDMHGFEPNIVTAAPPFDFSPASVRVIVDSYLTALNNRSTPDLLSLLADESASYPSSFDPSIISHGNSHSSGPVELFASSVQRRWGIPDAHLSGRMALQKHWNKGFDSTTAGIRPPPAQPQLVSTGSIAAVAPLMSRTASLVSSVSGIGEDAHIRVSFLALLAGHTKYHWSVLYQRFDETDVNGRLMNEMWELTDSGKIRSMRVFGGDGSIESATFDPIKSHSQLHSSYGASAPTNPKQSNEQQQPHRFVFDG